MIDIIPLFAIPIYRLKVDPNSYDKKSIIDTINYNYKIDEYRNTDGAIWGNLHHNYKDYENLNFKKINYNESGLINVYNNIMNEFTHHCLNMKKPFNYDYSFENYTATKKTQFMNPHTHLPGCDFAAVHYVQFEKGVHNPTRFHNMNDFSNYIRDIRPDMHKLISNEGVLNSYHFEYYNFDVEEDDMIIFPSFLKHEVPYQKKECDKIRMTLALNIRIKEIK